MTSTDMAGDGASTSADAGSDSAASPIGTAKAAASQMQGAVMQEAAHFASAAQDTVKDQAERQKATASEAARDFAAAIRKAADELKRNDRSTAGQMIGKAADGLEGLARNLSDKRPEELLQDLRDFGRSNPVAFVAGAALAGVAIGRFFRSSAQHGPGEPETALISASGPAGPGPAIGLDDGIGMGEGASASDNPDLGRQESMAMGMDGASTVESER